MTVCSSDVAAVRQFSRFYTRLVGTLDETYLASPFSLAEVRVLYELAHRESATASQLGAELSMDPGYLSRLVAGLARRRLISRARSATDARVANLSLTAKGRAAFAALDAGAAASAAAMLSPLDAARRARIVGAMQGIESAFAFTEQPEPEVTLRTHVPGDMGWVVQAHGEIYWREYRWDERFEALVAHVVADFIDALDARRERCWIAERAGERVGSVFLVRHPDRPGVAKLRLLLVDPSARGLGIGRRLADECTRFAREAGYHTITLWTNSVLVAARQIYTDVGYRIVATEPHTSFGHELTSETWELTL